MDEIVDLDVADRQQQMVLLGAFAGLALLLASIGIYGVLSYAVTQRSREIGLRIALGATAGSVMRIVVARGLALTAIGPVDRARARMGRHTRDAELLYGVTAADPSTFAAVVGLLGAIAFSRATFLPAARRGWIPLRSCAPSNLIEPMPPLNGRRRILNRAIIAHAASRADPRLRRGGQEHRRRSRPPTTRAQRRQ